MKIVLKLIILFIGLVTNGLIRALTDDEMLIILKDYDHDAALLCNKNAKANWDVQTDVLNQSLQDTQNKVILEYANYRKEQYNLHFKNAIIEDFTNKSIKRQLKLLKDVGTSILIDEDLSLLNKVKNSMTSVYNSARICPFNNKECVLENEGLTLDPEIELLLASSKNFDELLWVWQEWHDKSGKLMRENYKEYIQLMNKAAVSNNYEDAGEMWRSKYEDEKLIENVKKLWEQVEPLYSELHEYVRYQLLDVYGEKMDKNDPMIPAHLLGNMWAQSWVNLYDDIKPFKTASSVDVTQKMEELKYNALKMFEMSDEFYMSMGLPSSNMSYSDKAIIEKPEDRVVACHASAWDFCDREDFRVKMCTKVNMEDFVTVHHEMGHIMYYLLYKDQPLLYRTGANPAFHEAIGDTIALSVSTPQHLKTVELLDNYEDTEADNINALFHMALERVAFLPFGLLIDMWRWDVFSGKIPESEWNQHWWKLREEYQKVSAPVARSENDFDPGAKFHIPADSQYIAYFIAHILEFSFYRSLCIEAGQFDPENPSVNPLHKCDFYNNKKAGDKLKEGLELGFSEHWTVALEKLTGETEVSATALVDYFQPLHEFLKKENENERRNLEMQKVLESYDSEAALLCNENVIASWNVQTDVNNEQYKVDQNAAILKYANFRMEKFNDHFKDANVDDYTNPSIKRQLKILKDLGTSRLGDSDLSQLNKVKNDMSNIYNNAKICPFEKQECNLETEGLTLDPHIDNLMASSRDFEELKWTWNEWHENSGKLMRSDYKEYILLMNKAANANGYEDAGGMWRSKYEDEKLIENVKELWKEVEPLYSELHKYVHYQLLDLYGEKMDKNDSMIPAHLLGNMWAQSWVNLYDDIKPFKTASSVDVTQKMQELKYNALKMFEMSDEFYMSMGLPSSNMSYSDKAIIEKPEDRTIVCHASAWDFCDREDFRVKMCTKVNMEDFVTVHHEMGHIMYYLLYKDQPLLYRTGANPAFHEAIGDTIALSVSTPQHLKTVELLDNYEDTEADNINALFHMALERVAFLPFGLLIDMWRWDVFSGKIPESEWNQHWWKLREEYQKVSAPVARSEEHFDPGAKYHIPADSQYIAYFIAHILEFSFYRSLCIEAGQFDPENPSANPLHKCDFYNNKKAGDKFKGGLELGFSEHWTVALEKLTGENIVSAKALLEYFNPLYEYMKTENRKKRLIQNMPEILRTYEVEALDQSNKLVKAEWDVATDSNSQEKRDALEKAVLENAVFSRKNYEENFEGLLPDDFDDELIQRQIKYLTHLGKDALEENDLSELTKTLNEIETIYNNAKICPYDKQNCNLADEGQTLDPEIYHTMSNSSDYDELKWTWEQWREKSGKLMRNRYKKYVELSNKAAKLNNKSDYGEMWRESYEDENFIANINRMWDEVKPLYKELHTYVKRKLLKIYGDKMDADDELIPAHLFGNMWAQSWVNLYDRIKPFKDGSLIDITDKLKEKKYTVLQMFEISDKFYKDLGLEPNDMSYDESKGAVINKPTDRTITCHASAWDFYDGNDFRIKMCTNINQEDFVTIHHEMGHIQYFILYKDQPVVLRTGANPGFHEAVGDLIALSVSTPGHLKKIGLLDDFADTEEDNINALFKMALERVAFLPFGLLIDMWRWDVFSGKIPESEWNQHWWKLREEYQMVRAPVARSENDFDPGAKYHIPADSQYIAYFVAHILQFQMHRAVCIAAGQYDANDINKPLHKCDIDGSKEAGKLIKAGLELGLSKHWSVALQKITGETEISGKAVVEYFEPLMKFLQKENSVEEDKPSQLVPIIVGSVIGGIVVIGAAAYGIVRYQRNKQMNSF